MKLIPAIFFVFTFCSCTPPQSASFMPLMSYGTSLTNQAASLYMEQARIQQQPQMRNQQPYGYMP